MAATLNKDRQAAFKARMKALDKHQLTVFADEAQATAIRALLASEAPAAPKTSLDEDKLLARVKSLERTEQSLQDKEGLLNERQISFYEAEQNLRDRERQVREQELRLSKIDRIALEATASISNSERLAKLVEIHTTRKEWRTGARSKIDDSYTAAQNASAMRSLSSRTKAAASTITKLVEEYGGKELLSAGEAEALSVAARVLKQIGAVAGSAKDRVNASAAKVKLAEEKRQREAHAAAIKTFGEHMSPEDCVGVFVYTKAYELRYLPESLRTRDIKDIIGSMQRDAFGAIKSKIDGAMCASASAAEASAKIRVEFDAQRVAAIEANASLISTINTKFVASKLEAANAKEQRTK